MQIKSVISLLFLIPLFSFIPVETPKTANDVVKLIKQNVTCQWATQTVDTFKAGNPDSEVHGIATCMFADMKSLKKAVDLNCNFILTHEPIFYSHLDETSGLINDPVYLEKAKFISDNNLVVFRFHDHIHRTQPDGIYQGMLKKLDWKKNAVNGSQSYFKFSQTSLKDFAEDLKKKLGLQTIRVIGNPNMKFTKVGFAAGAPGGQSHIRMLQSPEIEILVAGEAQEWETYSYVNDAVEQGKNKAVIFLGHIKSEEAGMEYCANWLGKFVKDIPIHFIENESNFTEF